MSRDAAPRCEVSRHIETYRLAVASCPLFRVIRRLVSRGKLARNTAAKRDDQDGYKVTRARPTGQPWRGRPRSSEVLRVVSSLKVLQQPRVITNITSLDMFHTLQRLGKGED